MFRYRSVFDDSICPVGELAGTFRESNIGVFPFGLKRIADGFAVGGDVFGPAPNDDIVPLI